MFFDVFQQAEQESEVKSQKKWLVAEISDLLSLFVRDCTATRETRAPISTFWTLSIIFHHTTRRAFSDRHTYVVCRLHSTCCSIRLGNVTRGYTLTSGSQLLDPTTCTEESTRKPLPAQGVPTSKVRRNGDKLSRP